MEDTSGDTAFFEGVPGAALPEFDDFVDEIFAGDGLEDVLRFAEVDGDLPGQQQGEPSSSGSGFGEADDAGMADLGLLASEGTWRCLPGCCSSGSCSCTPPPAVEDEGMWELVGDPVRASAVLEEHSTRPSQHTRRKTAHLKGT